MNTKRMFLFTLLLAIILYETTSLLVPKGLSPNIIEDLEINYHSMKILYEQAVKIEDLLPKEDFSSISTFLDDFKNYGDHYKHQQNRSVLPLQKIYIQLQDMESLVDPADDPILNEELIKEQAKDLRKLVQELDEKIEGIKADPMMFTKEKADDLYERVQLLKEKFSSVSGSITDLYTVKDAQEAKIRQVDQLDRQLRTLEKQIEEEKYQKESKRFSYGSPDHEIRNLNQRLEEIQKHIEELEKPKPSMNLSETNVTKKSFHYIFLVDKSIRAESQSIFAEVDSNIETLKAARESERDIFSLLAFDKGVEVLAERLPLVFNSRHLRSIDPQSRKNYFEKGLEKAGQFLRKSRNKEEIPVVILFTDGLRWYWEAEPVLEEDERIEGFFWRIWKGIVNWFWSHFKKWFLKPIKESEIQEIKKQLADFSERFSDRNLLGFVSGTTHQNQEILRNFAKALNRNEILLQTTINENYEYFNLARATEVFPQIFKTLSVAERGSASSEYLREQARKRIEKETEELKKEIFGKSDEENFDKNKLLKEKGDLEKKVNELHRKKEKIQSEIENLVVEIERLQDERNFIESKILGLNEEILSLREKIFEQERMKVEREKLEAKYAEVRNHLDILEQLTKTVQARDHNILTIFEHIASHYKVFLMSLDRVLRDAEVSDFDLLITFYKDRMGLYGTDVENMEKIYQFWLGDSYDQAMAKNFFMMIHPREIMNGDLNIRKIEQAVEDLRERQNQYIKDISLDIDEITRLMRNERDFDRKKELEKNKFLLEENLKKIEQEVAKLKRRDLEDVKEEYVDFYLRLRKKIFAEKMEQKLNAMDSHRNEMKSFFSKETKEFLEKLEKKKYMMYWL